VEEAFRLNSYTRFLPNLNLPHDLPNPEQRQSLEGIELFAQVCRSIVTSWLESIVHIGPIRPLPERSYGLTEEFSRKLELGGWQAFLTYLKYRNRELESKVDRWLGILKLGKKLDRYGIGFREGVYDVARLRIDEMGNGDWRELVDVGFGASQILPVIMQCQAAAEDALVLIEQPELHLHPEAQADIADMFIESVNELITERLEINKRQLGEAATAAQKEEKKRSVTRRYLIETHSETIFWRLRVELAKTTAKLADKYPFRPEFLRGYFVYRDACFGYSSIGKLSFDRLGEYADSSGQFGDFFGQDAAEMDDLDFYVSQIKE
jgi:hypothetical protein